MAKQVRLLQRLTEVEGFEEDRLFPVAERSKDFSLDSALTMMMEKL